uniref:G-protein coupled receptors family 1 profile domain-containing protein n=1 Tax=Plectus sambesii TaxID=2011161 RepID=A0A914V575_9BILA
MAGHVSGGQVDVMFHEVEVIDHHCPRMLNRSSMNDSEWERMPFDNGCLQKMFLELRSHLKRYSDWEEAVYTTVYAIISILAVIGNGLVIFAILRKREMRTNRNVFILNLALSNLTLGLINIPFLWLPSIDFEFPYSQIFCKFANALPGSNIYCSTLTISVMGIDRYYTVKNISMSSARRRSFRAIAIAIGIWLVSFALSIPLLIYYDITMLWVFKDVQTTSAGDVTMTELKSYGWRQCKLVMGQDKEEGDNDSGKEQAVSLAVSILQVVFLYVVPIIVLSIFNVKLTRFLQENSRQVNVHRTRVVVDRADSSSSRVLPSMSRSASRITDHSHSLCNGLERNGSLCKQNGRSDFNGHKPSIVTCVSPAVMTASERRRSRTTALLIAMAASYACLWFPYIIITFLLDLNVIDDLLHIDPAVVERLDQSFKVVSMMSICVNPFLYGFLNTNFKREFNDIFNTWVRCRKPSLSRTGSRSRGYTQEFSSVAMPLRHESFVSSGSMFGLAALRASLRRSFRRRNESNASVGGAVAAVLWSTALE